VAVITATQPLSAAPDRRQVSLRLPVAPFVTGKAYDPVSGNGRKVGHSPVSVTAPPAHAALARTRVSTPVCSGLARVGRFVRSTYTGYLCGRVYIYRRSKPASFELTMLPLCQAPLLGRLCLASRLPFRASYFTTGLHPPAATAQGHTDCLYSQ